MAGIRRQTPRVGESPLDVTVRTCRAGRTTRTAGTTRTTGTSRTVRTSRTPVKTITDAIAVKGRNHV
jgi:hypothetical protein